MNKQSATTPGWQLEADSAEAYERYLASAFRPWVADLIALAGLKPRERVLDAACGTGIVARSAAPIVGAGGKIVGIDINADMLRVARAVSNGVQPEIEVARFLPLVDFTGQVTDLVQWVKSSAVAPGVVEVLIPGEPEARSEAHRRARGIPVEAETWRQIEEIAAELNVG